MFSALWASFVFVSSCDRTHSYEYILNVPLRTELKNCKLRRFKIRCDPGPGPIFGIRSQILGILNMPWILLKLP